MRVPWTARRSSQSILSEIIPEYSLERMMLKLNLQYFGHLCQRLTHWNSPWCWEILMAGEERVRGWEGWMASPMQWAWTWANPRRWWGTGKPGVLKFMGSQRVGHDWAAEQQHCHLKFLTFIHLIYFNWLPFMLKLSTSGLSIWIPKLSVQAPLVFEVPQLSSPSRFPR